MPLHALPAGTTGIPVIPAIVPAEDGAERAGQLPLDAGTSRCARHRRAADANAYRLALQFLLDSTFAVVTLRSHGRMPQHQHFGINAPVRSGQVPAWPFFFWLEASQRLPCQGWPKAISEWKSEAPLMVEGCRCTLSGHPWTRAQPRPSALVMSSSTRWSPQTAELASSARVVSRSVAMQETRQRSLASWVSWAVQVVSPPSPSSVSPWSAVIRRAKPV
jgi:hypothetical protein